MLKNKVTTNEGRVKEMRQRLSSYEQETIISFNKAEDTAYIFSYEKGWQQHLEKKLGLKPIMDNGFGGKEYRIDKKRIRPPRAPVKLSAEARKRLAKRLSNSHRQKSILRSQNNAAVVKSAKRNRNKGNTIN
jgi:hypothetical protein